MNTYAITCDCGKEITGAGRRDTEGKMWHHAIHDHGDMIKDMSASQFTGVMEGWDKKFTGQEK